MTLKSLLAFMGGLEGKGGEGVWKGTAKLPFLPAAIADRTSNTPSCCCCWGGDFLFFFACQSLKIFCNSSPQVVELSLFLFIRSYRVVYNNC